VAQSSDVHKFQTLTLYAPSRLCDDNGIQSMIMNGGDFLCILQPFSLNMDHPESAEDGRIGDSRISSMKIAMRRSLRHEERDRRMVVFNFAPAPGQ
jgi:hypothetical protein